MRLASIAVLAVAATLAGGLQPAGAVHNDRYCVRDDCSYHNWKQMHGVRAWTCPHLQKKSALARVSAGWPIARRGQGGVPGGGERPLSSEKADEKCSF